MKVPEVCHLVGVMLAVMGVSSCYIQNNQENQGQLCKLETQQGAIVGIRSGSGLPNTV